MRCYRFVQIINKNIINQIYQPAIRSPSSRQVISQHTDDTATEPCNVVFSDRENRTRRAACGEATMCRLRHDGKVGGDDGNRSLRGFDLGCCSAARQGFGGGFGFAARQGFCGGFCATSRRSRCENWCYVEINRWQIITHRYRRFT